jgi:hypothetical protein
VNFGFGLQIVKRKTRRADLPAASTAVTVTVWSPGFSPFVLTVTFFSVKEFVADVFALTLTVLIVCPSSLTVTDLSPATDVMVVAGMCTRAADALQAALSALALSTGGPTAQY